ncbi:MAG: hypothetical protein KAI66_24000 [Lentisphaeria bacterium]|nr:hypothetical protein [Lentisphaeria bacterium]
MADENAPQKVKLRKADTSRLKVETGPQRAGGATPGTPNVPVAPKNIKPPTPAEDDVPTAEVSSPMGRRQTSHNKLRRIQSTPEGGAGVGDEKNATVRLKVVHGPKKPMGPNLTGPTAPTPPEQAASPEDSSPTVSVPASKAQVRAKRSTDTLRIEPKVVKKGTDTLKVDEPVATPDNSPGGTIKVPAPGDMQPGVVNSPFKDTSTSTIKLKLKTPPEESDSASTFSPVDAEAVTQQTPATPKRDDPGESKAGTSTLKIRAGKPVKSADGGSKSSSATLKIRPPAAVAAAKAAGVVDKGQTAELKVRPGPASTAAASAAATVKIKPAAPAAPAAPGGAKKSLKLKKSGGASAGQQDVTIGLPGVGTSDAPPAPDAAATVSVTPPEDASAGATVAVKAPPAAEPAAKKGGLKLKGAPGKTQAAKPAPEGAPAPGAAAAPAATPSLKPSGEQSGGGVFSGICSMLAAAAAVVLVVRLALDLMQQVLQ